MSLAGELRPVRGALALALAMRRRHAQRTLVLPAVSAQQAALATGLDVREAQHLLDVVRAMRDEPDAPTLPRARATAADACGTPRRTCAT